MGIIVDFANCSNSSGAVRKWGHADTSLKRHLSRQQCEETCPRYTRALKKGHILEYFGQRKQRGMAVHVWKASARGEGEDALVTLVMKDGKVSGVWVL